MIHVLLAVQAFDVGGFSVSITDVRNNAALVTPRAGGGGLYMSAPFLTVGTFDLAAFGGVSVEAERYILKQADVSLATGTGELEVGGRFRFGSPSLLGLMEFGAGTHVRAAMAGGSLVEVRPVYGTHTMFGAEFGERALRGVAGLRVAFSFGNGGGWPDHSRLEDNVQVDWDWQPTDVRLQLCGGVAFGGKSR